MEEEGNKKFNSIFHVALNKVELGRSNVCEKKTSNLNIYRLLKFRFISHEDKKGFLFFDKKTKSFILKLSSVRFSFFGNKAS